ncbi:hypothetical protein SRHO_G00308700 [Serrasalmus rhombeus]
MSSECGTLPLIILLCVPEKGNIKKAASADEDDLHYSSVHFTHHRTHPNCPLHITEGDSVQYVAVNFTAAPQPLTAESPEPPQTYSQIYNHKT